MAERIRIKDIAKMADVSVGTVDRVIHGRSGVSEASRKRVEEILKQLDYQPNMYASALASNKKYAFSCLLPQHEEGEYWTAVEAGIHDALIAYSDFNISVDLSFYDPFDYHSFVDVAQGILEQEPDGVMFAPTVPQHTKSFTEELNRRSTPYIYIGYGSDSHTQEMWIDDIAIYRNQITDSQCQMPNIGGEGGAFEYLVGDPIITVGAEDNSAAWWTAFSNYFRMPADGNMKFKFTNHTSGAGNWNNWCFCLCTDAERNGSDYAEYFVIRSDLYGWGDSYGSGIWTNEGYGDWDAFRADMEGAEVTVTVQRSGATATVEAVAKAINGNVYKETFTTTCGDGTQVVRGFFIMDGSHIVFDTEETTALTIVPLTKTTIGAEDCSTAWWTEFSDYFQIPVGQNLHLEFENHTSGAGNWNNWNLCLCTDAERNGSDYAEYFVIRSDLYGWGDSYASGTWTNEGYGDWDAFRADMEGATVVIDIQRNGATVTATAIATGKNGNVYKEVFVTDCGDGNQTVRAFLIVDGAHLKMDQSNCYLYTPLFK